MPDRIIRDEILESDRWLDLRSDTHRLAYLGLILLADDMGNFEGGPRRVFRALAKFTSVKTESSSNSLMAALADADLVRRYEVDGREFWHIPRFRPHRQYLVRKAPMSPWDADVSLGKTQRVHLRGKAKDQHEQSLRKNVVAMSLLRSSDVVATSQPCSSHVAQGVGVGEGAGAGEGVGPVVDSLSVHRLVADEKAGFALSRDPPTPKPKAKQKLKKTALPRNWTLPLDWMAWALGERPSWGEPDAIACSLRFRDYWLSNGETKADWEATWRGWVRRENGARPAAKGGDPNAQAAENWLKQSGGATIDGECKRD